ncbi:hypothetical protein DY000_02039374 [Brassica cretica]|uniref:Uncharacterized protein n=1 Tax=Brassica cretica TaxID=69181 RepID=A0ABQ7BFW5_BRACR|nr:hypothetical protein DY000_02039374 [Brassica cretica]
MNFRRYYDADTRDQSSSEKLCTDGERSSDNSDVEDSSVYSDGRWFVGIYRRTLVVGIYRRIFVRRYIPTEIGSSEIAYGPPTTFRRNSDGCKAVRRNSVGIVQSQTAIQRSYIFVGNGHMVRLKFVGKFRRNSDDFTVNRNVVGNFVGIYRRTSDDYNSYIFYRNVVEKSSENSDDPCFVGIPSEMADGIPTTSIFWISSEIGRERKALHARAAAVWPARAWAWVLGEGLVQ